jgi:hypothetical protein
MILGHHELNSNFSESLRIASSLVVPVVTTTLFPFNHETIE